MKGKKAQIAPEAVLVAGVMLFFLLSVYIASGHLKQQNAILGQSLQASAAASQVAIAINKVAAAGNGSKIVFFNSAAKGVSNITIYGGRAVKAACKAGCYVSVPLSTNNTILSGSTIPLNSNIYVNNTEGTIYIGEL